MDFSLYTKDDLRTQLRHIRGQQIRMDETAARWCERGLDTEDPVYKMLRASAGELAGLGDQLYAEISRRNQAEDGQLAWTS